MPPAPAEAMRAMSAVRVVAGMEASGSLWVGGEGG